MRVTVKLFAMLRERAGMATFALEVPEGSAVAAMAEAIVARHPALGTHMRSVVYAVNREYADGTTILHDGDELALIPPVSGG